MVCVSVVFGAPMLTWQSVYEYFVRIEGKEWLLTGISLAISLAVTGVWTFVMFCWLVVRNFMLAREFQLSGEYLAFYETPRHDAGQRGRMLPAKNPRGNVRFERVRANSFVRQRGKVVTIRMVESSGRAWIHEGRIVLNRFISGSYYPKAPHDEGVGAFFLEIKGAGRLEGEWHGYDNEGKKIASGPYMFFKKSETRIVQMSNKHFPGVLEIARRAFGDGYMTGADVSKVGALGLVALVDGETIGFCLSMMLPKGGLDAFFCGKPQRNAALKHADQEGTIGVVKSLAVEETKRNSSVGTQLFCAAERQLRDKNASVFLVPVWHRQHVLGLRPIAELNGFQLLQEDDAYWKESCDAGEFACVARTADKCICTCRFYIKTRRAD